MLLEKEEKKQKKNEKNGKEEENEEKQEEKMNQYVKSNFKQTVLAIITIFSIQNLNSEQVLKVT